MSNGVIEVRVSLKGRPIRDYRFADSRITIGRDPGSHIFLDNPGISRHHAVLVQEGADIVVEDQDSANGTFLNEEQIRRAPLRDGDKVRIGKFLIELRRAQERRGFNDEMRPQATAHEGTMVLEAAQIERLMVQTKKAEQEAAVRPPVAEPVVVGNVLRAPEPVRRPTASPVTSLSDASAVSAPAVPGWRGQSRGLIVGLVVGIAIGVLVSQLVFG
ncbi:MAG: FHA domain-containing protein [Candidatus Eisenbacteria bacterium]